MTDVLIFTVGLVLVLRAISSGLKRIGFKPEALWVVEIVLGVGAVEAGIALGALVVTGQPAGGPQFFFGAIYGAIAGLSAAGLYTNTHTVTSGPTSP